MFGKHALFDTDSLYGRLRACFEPLEKLQGYIYWLIVRALQPGFGAAGGDAGTTGRPAVGRAPASCLVVHRTPIKMWVVIGGGDGSIRLYEPATGHLQTRPVHHGAVSSVTVLDDDQVVSGGEDGTICVWDLGSGQLRTLGELSGSIWAVAAFGPGRTVSASQDGTVALWDTRGGHVGRMREHDGAAYCLAVLNGGRVASGGEDCTVKLWEPERQDVATWRGHRGAVRYLAAVDAGHLASGSDDGMVKLWDLQTATAQTLAEHANPVHCLCAGGGRVVSGSADHTVVAWDLAAGAARTLRQHTGRVNSVAVLPDGRVVSGGADHRVHLWDPLRDSVRTLPASLAAVEAVGVLDERRVVAADCDGTLVVWDLETADLRMLDRRSLAASGDAPSALIGPPAAPAGAARGGQARAGRTWPVCAARPVLRLAAGPHDTASRTGIAPPPTAPNARVDLWIRRGPAGAEHDTLIIDACGLPPQERACRFLLVDLGVVGRLRQVLPHLDPADDERALQQVLADDLLRENREIARILSAVPDVDARVDSLGFVYVEAQIPAGCPDLPVSTCVVLVLDETAEALEPITGPDAADDDTIVIRTLVSALPADEAGTVVPNLPGASGGLASYTSSFPFLVAGSRSRLDAGETPAPLPPAVAPPPADHPGPDWEEEGAGLTVWLRRDDRAFLAAMRQVAPLMMERIGLVKVAEATRLFVEYLWQPAVLDRLRQVPHVRDELGPLLAEFCRQQQLTPDVDPARFVDRRVMDNILWQVAAALVRADWQTQPPGPPPQLLRYLDHVEYALRRELRAGAHAEPEAITRTTLADAPPEARQKIETGLQARMAFLR